MLTVSSRAASALRRITEHSADGNALRIAPSATPGASPGFSLSVCSNPSTTDHVMNPFGISIFVDVAAAPALANKVLDVDDETDGSPKFFIAGGKTPPSALRLK